MTAEHAARLHQPTDGGEHAPGHVDPDLHAVDVDPSGSGRLGVTADGINGPAPAVVTQEQADAHENDHGGHERHRDLAPISRTKIGKGRGQAEQGLRFDDAVLQSGQHDGHAQGDYEGVEAALDDEQAVEHADERAHQEQHQDPDIRI